MIPPHDYERILLHLDSDLTRIRAITCAMQKEVDKLKDDFYKEERKG